MAQYDGTFSFQYSPRPNTAAALMADPVPESEKARRLQALQERQRGIQVQRNQSWSDRRLKCWWKARRDESRSGRVAHRATEF